MSPALGLAVVVVIAAGCGTDGRGSPASTSGGDRSLAAESAWRQLLDRQLDDGVGEQLALDAFATLIGPVPGGTPVAAERLGTTSGTPAVRWLLSHWDRLAADQRQAVGAVLGGPLAEDRASLRGFAPARRGGDEPRAALEAEIEATARDIAADFAAEFSIELPPNLFVAFGRPPDDRDRVLATAYGVDNRGNPGGQASVCTVTIYPLLVEIYLSERGSEAMPRFETTLAHEWFHCHQFLRAGTRSDQSWLREGSAEWAGLRYAFRDEPVAVAASTFWADYFAEPQQSLFRRSYDAIGFFAHLEHSGADPWAAIDAMLGRDDPAAFDVAVSRGGPGFLALWAMGAVGDGDLGRRWRTDGPGLADLPRPDLVDVGTVVVGDELVIGGASGATIARGEIDVDGGVPAIQASIAGHGGFAFHTISGVEDEFFEGGPTVAQDRWYCVDVNGCACPDDQEPSVRSVSRRGTSRITVALTGGVASSQLTLRGATVDELCAADDVPLGGDARCERLVELTAAVLGEALAPGQDVDVGAPPGVVCSFPLAPRGARTGFPGGLMIMRVGVPVPEFCREVGLGSCAANLVSAEYVVVGDVHIEYIHGGIWRSEEVRPLIFELIGELD